MDSLPHVVVFPFPAQGHINPGLQFARALASSLSPCRVTFISTSHNIAKLRASPLHLSPYIRLQALADDGKHGHDHAFFEQVEHMGHLLEALLLELLQTKAPKVECSDVRAEDGRIGYGDLNAHGAKKEISTVQKEDCGKGYGNHTGYGDCIKAGGDQQTSGGGSIRSHQQCKKDDDWPPPICVISDVFLGWVQDIADKLDLPRFILYTPSPATLVLMLSLPEMLQQGRLPCNDVLDEAQEQPLNLPGLTETLRLTDVPSHLLLPPSAFMFKYFLRHSKRISDAAAVLVNTFGDLQQTAVSAAGVLLDAYPSTLGSLLLKHQLSRVIPVGPLLPPSMFDGSKTSSVSAKSRANGAENELCLQWLERQSPASVVYVSFGSMGELSKEQIEQLAWGLEASGKPFLWVMREDSARFLPVGFNVGINKAARMSVVDSFREVAKQGDVDSKRMALDPKGMHPPISDMCALDLRSASSSLLTEHEGLVVSWAPQLDVLSHPSVAAFLSHCGWNSTLEAISAGVPVLSWPLFAEQKMNCRFLVDELKVAMEFGKGEDGLVGKEEVERVIKESLETERGGYMRSRAFEWRKLARNAVTDGGSSLENIKAFGSLLSSLHTT